MTDDVKPMTAKKWVECGQWNSDDEVVSTREQHEAVHKALKQRERLAELFEQQLSHSLHGCELEYRHRYGGWVIHPDKDAGWDVADAGGYDSAIEALQAADEMNAKERPNEQQ